MSAEIREILRQFESLSGAQDPCTVDEIRAAERRLHFRMTEDFTTAYTTMDGTLTSTPPEHGWVMLWPLAKWYTVQEYVEGYSGQDRAGFQDILRAVVFADYSLESWHYAALFPRFKRAQSAAIYLLHLRPHLVASSLSAFLSSVVNDAPEMYPPN